MTTKSKKSKDAVKSTNQDTKTKLEMKSTEYKKPTRYNSSNIGELVDTSEFNARGLDFLCKRLNGVKGSEVHGVVKLYGEGKLEGLGSELEELLGFRDGDLRRGSGLLMILLGRRCTLGGSGVGVGSRSFGSNEIEIISRFCAAHNLWFYGLSGGGNARVAADLVAPETLEDNSSSTEDNVG